MASKSNMERAKREERWFWVAAVLAICMSACLFFGMGPKEARGEESFLSFPLFMVTGIMAGCVFRLTRAYKREIADLTTDEPDVSAEPQDSE